MHQKELRFINGLSDAHWEARFLTLLCLAALLMSGCNSQIEVRAVLMPGTSRALPLESLRIKATPADDVIGLRSKLLNEIEVQLECLNKLIFEADEAVLKSQRQLEAARQEVRKDYDAHRSVSADMPRRGQRDPLKTALAAREKQTNAETRERFLTEKDIKPAEDALDIKTSQADILHGKKQQLLNSIGDLVFDSLPRNPAFSWTTNVQGKAEISLPGNSAWIVWAEKGSLRWLLAVPDELDASHRLFLDHNNVFQSDSYTLNHLRQECSNYKSRN